MAQVPKAVGNSPYEAAPEKLAGSPLPLERTEPVMEGQGEYQPGLGRNYLSELSPQDVDVLRQSFSGLSDQEIQAQLDSENVGQNEREVILGAIGQIRRQQSAAPLQQGGLFAEQPKSMDEYVQKYRLDDPVVLSGLAKGAAGIGIGIAAGAPAVMGGRIAGSAAGLMGAGQRLSKAIGATTAGGLSLMTEEGVNNLLRQELGLPEEDLGFWGKTLNAASAALGGALATPVKVPGAINKAVAQQALKMQQTAKFLMNEYATAQGMSQVDKQAFLSGMDEMISSNAIFYRNAMGLSPERAVQQSIIDATKSAKAYGEVESVIERYQDLSRDELLAIAPAKGGFEAQRSANMAMMSRAEEALSKEVSDALEASRKNPVLAEGIFIPAERVLGRFDELITAAMPTITEGKYVFQNGNLLLRTRGGLKPLTSEVQKSMYESMLRDPYKAYLLQARNDVLQNYKGLRATGEMRKIGPRQSAAVYGSRGVPADFLFDSLREIKQRLQRSLPKDKGAVLQGQDLAAREVSASITSLENEMLQQMMVSPIPSLAQAANKYAKMKEYSTLSAQVLDPIIQLTNGDPQSMMGVLRTLDPVKLERLRDASREVVDVGGATVLNEKLPDYFARMLLNDQMKGFDFAAGPTGALGRRGIEQAKEFSDKVLKNPDFDIRMNILTGGRLAEGKGGLKLAQKGTWEQDKKALGAFFENATKQLERLQKAERAGNGKLTTALEANIFQQALRLTTGGKFNLFMYPIRTFLEQFGTQQLANRLNRLVFAENLDDVVKAISNPAMAMRERERIIKAFGDRDPVALRMISDFDKKYRESFLRRMATGMGSPLTAKRGMGIGALEGGAAALSEPRVPSGLGAAGVPAF